MSGAAILGLVCLVLGVVMGGLIMALAVIARDADSRIESETDVPMWIVRYWHRYGDDIWPVYGKGRPSHTDIVAQLLRDGVEVDLDREDEGVEVFGPFVLPIVRSRP